MKTEENMTDIVSELREKNPGLRLYSVLDAEFSRYGRTLEIPGARELASALASAGIPPEGNSYAASIEALEATAAVRHLAVAVYGCADVQAGCCSGRGFTLNAEEYHKCSEVNFSTTGLVLLLALPEDIRGGRLDSSDVVGFYLPPMTAVEIYPLVLHFAPCRIADSGFDCLVVLTRGTNGPIDCVDASLPGERGMLWMRNKWLLCHPDSPQAAKGAYVGIDGENISLNI